MPKISTQLVFVLLFSNVCVGQRISSILRPVHYDLVILPIINGNNPRLCGSILINLIPSGTTNVVTFHGVELNILDISVEEAPVNDTINMTDKDRLNKVEELCFSGVFDKVSQDVDAIKEDTEKQQVSIVLKQNLRKNQGYRIGIFYTGKVRDSNVGFFRANYKNDNSSCHDQGWFGGTHMEAAHARKVLPCWDEPAFKATFDITMGHASSMSALSNMPEASTEPMEYTRDWMWTRFDRSPIMSTYLLAMVVTDYQRVERIYKVCNRTVQMRFWGQPGQLPNLNETITAVPHMLNHMETYLRQPLTVPKIDFIASPIPLVFVAMENWGLILFTEPRLFFDNENGCEEDRLQVLQSVGHELAHQFFGNLVSAVWWDDIWFYEGFSVVFEFDLVKKIRPDLQFHTEHNWITTIQTAMKVEEYSNTVPVIRSVETAEDAENMFDHISYSKGNAILQMLRNFVGRENFRNAIITFMERYRFQNVESTKFMEILNERLDRNKEIGHSMNVTTIVDSWTRQPSYPIVRCTRMSNGRIRLSQMPHPGLLEISPEENVTQLWWIPLALTDARQPDFSPEGTSPSVWLTPQRPVLEIPYFSPSSTDQSSEDENTWILVNGEMSSYIRVLYDEHNLRLLAHQLMINHTVIPQVSRAQLIDDAFTLVLIEHLDYNVVLNLIEYLTAVKDEFVRSTVMFHLTWMEGRIMYRNATLYKLFQDYLARLTFNEGNETTLNNLARSGGSDTLDDIGCLNWSDGLCLDKVFRLFRAQMDDTITVEDNRAMMANLERNWCAVLRHGGQTEWEWTWQTSLGDQWASKRSKILSAMSCTQDLGRLKQLLSRVLHPSIDQDPEDTLTIIERMAENPVARSVVLNFVKTNWEFLGQHLKRSEDRLKLLVAASKYLSTPEEYEEMSQFIDSRLAKDKNLDRSIIMSVLDGIRSNNRWIEKHSDEVYSLLEAQKTTQEREQK